MGKRFVITEEERINILSAYKLLFEESATKVLDGLNIYNEPIYKEIISLYNPDIDKFISSVAKKYPEIENERNNIKTQYQKLIKMTDDDFLNYIKTNMPLFVNSLKNIKEQNMISSSPSMAPGMMLGGFLGGLASLIYKRRTEGNPVDNKQIRGKFVANENPFKDPQKYPDIIYGRNQSPTKSYYYFTFDFSEFSTDYSKVVIEQFRPLLKQNISTTHGIMTLERLVDSIVRPKVNQNVYTPNPSYDIVIYAKYIIESNRRRPYSGNYLSFNTNDTKIAVNEEWQTQFSQLLQSMDLPQWPGEQGTDRYYFSNPETNNLFIGKVKEVLPRFYNIPDKYFTIYQVNIQY